MRALIALCLAGCCIAPTPSPRTEVAPPAESPGPVRLAQAPTGYALHAVTWLGDELDACMDVYSPEPIETQAELQEIAQPCAEAFAGRLELATCTVGDATRGVVIRQYRLASAESDADMRACLEMHGRWSALPRDSPELARARLRQHAETLRALSGRRRAP